MAEAAGFAPSTIHRIWKAFNLQPHRTETFKLSTDPLFIEKVRDIAGLSLVPPERAMVLCVAGKSQIRRWTGPSRRCSCGRDRSSGAPMTMSAMEP